MEALPTKKNTPLGGGVMASDEGFVGYMLVLLGGAPDSHITLSCDVG